MFTGIIEEIGTVRAVRAGRTGAVLDIEASKVLEGTAVGDSIAVNGVCLTVTPDHGSFTADAMPETLRRTSLGSLSVGSKVNLERAMLCGGRFGGHIVSGHVDACGRVVALEKDGIALLMRVSVPGNVLKYIAEKGSVTLDGTSLTVASVSYYGCDYPASASGRFAGQCGGGHAGPVRRAAPALRERSRQRRKRRTEYGIFETERILDDFKNCILYKNGKSDRKKVQYHR